MPKKRSRIGIVGSGNIFKKHLEGILSNGDSFEVVGVANHNREIDLEFPKAWDVKTFYDHKEMFSKLGNSIDLVVILVQSLYHYDIAKEALEAGYDVLIEKPIASEVSKLKELNELEEKVGKKVYAVLQCRYFPVLGSLEKILEGKILGDIRCVDYSQVWQRPVGYLSEKQCRFLFEYGIHFLDLIQILFGVPKVFFTKTFNHKHKNAPHEDTIRSIVEYDGGVSGSIWATLAAEPKNIETRLLIIGSKGYLDVDFRENEIKGFFENEEDEKIFNEIINNSTEVDAFKRLYEDIYLEKGIAVSDSIPVIQFIENVYAKEEK